MMQRGSVWVYMDRLLASDNISRTIQPQRRPGQHRCRDQDLDLQLLHGDGGGQLLEGLRLARPPLRHGDGLRAHEVCKLTGKFAACHASKKPRLLTSLLPFSLSTLQSDGSYIDTDSSSALTLYLGTKNKPMYGAGRSMQDMLESGRGLTLVVRVRSRSSYRVIGNLVRSSYRHDAECQLVLRGAYDEGGHTVIYNSTCFISTAHA